MTFNTELWNGQAPGAAGGYEIERSLRFNSGDSAFLSRTPSTAGNRKTWTWAGWVKRSKLTINQWIFSAASGPTADRNNFLFNTDDKLVVGFNISGTWTNSITDAVFRDVSAWYHIVVALDTTQSTDSNRTKIYVNGVQQTLTGTYPAQNADTPINDTVAHSLGRYEAGSSDYFNGYLADVHFLDGIAVSDATDFGEFDATTGAWNPIAYTGTYGTNGFHLDFSDNSSPAALGYDAAGSNDWTVNNISGLFYSGTALFNASLNATPFSDATGNETITNNGSITTSAAGTNSFNISNAGDFGGSSQWLAVTTVTIPTNYTIDYYYKSTNATQVSNATVIDSNGEVFIRDYGSATSRKIRLNDGSATDYSYTITNNTWNHVRVTNTGIWVNGTSINSSPKNIAGRSAGVTIGSYNNAGGYQFDGLIGPIRILDANLGAPTAGGEPTDSGSLPNTETTSSSTGADNDSLRDSPTNGDTANDTGLGGEVPGNYCTANPLDNAGITLANGNLDISNTSAAWANNRGTLGVSSGKWYWEITCSSVSNSSNYATIGIAGDGAFPSGSAFHDLATAYAYYSFNGQKFNSGAGSAYGDTYTTNDVIGVALDLDAGTLKFYKNGTVQNSGTAAFTGLTGTFRPAVGLYGSSCSVVANFGARAFSYTAPSGFKALCTANLPTPTIEDGSAYMDATLYTGNGTGQTISGLDMSPDFVWVKCRSNAESNCLFDQVRGADEFLLSDSTAAESDYGGGLGVTAFTSDGFTLGNGSAVNGNTRSFVAWTWDGGSSTVSNTDGSITSQVRANPTAGFSIVTYTGNLTTTPGTAPTVGHGLNAAPQLIISKSRNPNGDDSGAWYVNHAYNYDNWFRLNLTNAGQSIAASGGGTTADPTSSVFSTYFIVGSNCDNNNYVAYCFAPVESYSSFGSYQGNGSTDGPFVYTGFRPRWIMTKSSSTGGTGYDWHVYDTARDTYNAASKFLDPNTSQVEQTRSDGANITTMYFDILSNGFKLRNGLASPNQSGVTYIYAAFAEHPQKYSRAR